MDASAGPFLERRNRWPPVGCRLMSLAPIPSTRLETHHLPCFPSHVHGIRWWCPYLVPALKFVFYVLLLDLMRNHFFGTFWSTPPSFVPVIDDGNPTPVFIIWWSLGVIVFLSVTVPVAASFHPPCKKNKFESPERALERDLLFIPFSVCFFFHPSFKPNHKRAQTKTKQMASRSDLAHVWTIRSPVWWRNPSVAVVSQDLQDPTPTSAT